MRTITTQPLTSKEREQLRHVIIQASKPIAQFWPMKTFIHHNPIHGLEPLPFDQAIREAKYLLGGNGYLSNEEYRQCYRTGRITKDGVKQAFERIGLQETIPFNIQIGGHQITTTDIWWLHLVFGIEALDPAMLQWTFKEEGATKRFRHDLSDGSQRRIIERTIRECEQCQNDPQAAYLTNLWNSTLLTLQLSDSGSKDAVHDEQYHVDRKAFDERRRFNIGLPMQRTISDWVEVLAGVPLVEQINNQMIKWSAAFVDEGIARWNMPLRHEGFYRAWQELAQSDDSGKFLGIKAFTKKISTLPQGPEEAIVFCLHGLGIPQKHWKDYLARQFAQLSGWAGFIQWRGDHPDYHAQRTHPIDSAQYLAVRLFYEVELTQVVCQQAWGIDGTMPALVQYWQQHGDDYAQRMGQGAQAIDPMHKAICRDAWRLFHLAQFLELSPLELHDLSFSDAHTLLNRLDAFPSDQHGPVWLEAYEEAYREQLLAKLSAHRETIPPLATPPRAQVVFCIDVRSESFRRHLEAQGPYETFGFAGFFGIPISHYAFDRKEPRALCPVLLTPKHAVTETPRPDQQRNLERYASRSRWHQLGAQLFHDLKANPIGSMILIDLAGFFFSLALTGKTLMLKPYHRIKTKIQAWSGCPVATQITVGHSPSSDPEKEESAAKGSHLIEKKSLDGLALGFSIPEQATFLENGLRAMGLTKNFARLVVLCGHGSQTDNNPYFGALDCGACGGNHGDPNARVFAKIGNKPEVRRLLKEKGLMIPADTWFLAGKHNTTTDRVVFYDVEDVPGSHAEDVHLLSRDLVQTGANQALERCHRLPSAPTNLASKKAFTHAEERSIDWANPRPEWGLSGNAAFIIGKRRLTKGLDLQGRVFLHSYDPGPDIDGAILEKIMTAPLIVGEWINMEHYFSAADPWVYGSGSKVIHNVVAGIGVMLGSHSDLQTGLPLQTVNNGTLHYHEPMRLLTIIEASPSRISPIIQKHDLLQQLFHNQWVNLIALDPETYGYHRYNPDATWEAIPANQFGATIRQAECPA